MTKAKIKGIEIKMEMEVMEIKAKNYKTTIKEKNESNKKRKSLRKKAENMKRKI